MGDQIQNYSVIPDAETISQSERDRFIEQTMKGLVDERGYCPLEPSPMGGGMGYWDGHSVNQPVKLGEYEQMPDARWGGKMNPSFQKLHYQNAEGNPGSMIVHIDIVNQNPNLNGLDGLLIKDAILSKTE